MTERFPIEYPQARLLPVCVLFTLAMGIFLPGGLRLLALVVAVLGVVVWLVARRFQPVLVVGDSGYSVEKLGRETLRVAWSEVVQVKADAAEEALYVDAGDPARNLLVPPRRGFGFRFGNSARLFRLVLQNIPREKVRQVERL